MLSVVIEAFKKSVILLCTPFANRCLVYSDWPLYHLTQFIRLVGIFPVQIHLIGIRNSPDHRSARNKEVMRLSLYEFTLWSRDLMSVVRIRERVRIIEVFLMKIYGNFVGTLETVRNRGVRIREVRLYRNSVLVDFLIFFL